MPTKEQYLGGFLIGEAALSIIFSLDKTTLSQIGRLARMGIGYYIYTSTLTRV